MNTVTVENHAACEEVAFYFSSPDSIYELRSYDPNVSTQPCNENISFQSGTAVSVDTDTHNDKIRVALVK